MVEFGTNDGREFIDSLRDIARVTSVEDIRGEIFINFRMGKSNRQIPSEVRFDKSSGDVSGRIRLETISKKKVPEEEVVEIVDPEVEGVNYSIVTDTDLGEFVEGKSTGEYWFPHITIPQTKPEDVLDVIRGIKNG
jgi:hypothetical protein